MHYILNVIVVAVFYTLYILTHTYSILFRLYWYPTKAIYSAQHVSVKIYPNGPFYLLFVPMLWALYAMQVRHNNQYEYYLVILYTI